MSDIDFVQQSSQSQQTQQTQQTQSAQEEQQVQPLDSGDNVDMNARFTSYNEFAQTYPTLHKAMLNGIAQSVITDLKHHDERMKKIMKENQSN